MVCSWDHLDFDAIEKCLYNVTKQRSYFLCYASGIGSCHLTFVLLNDCFHVLLQFMILGKFSGIAINIFLEMGKCYAEVFLACLHYLLYIIVNSTPFMKVKMYGSPWHITYWCDVLFWLIFFIMVSSIDMSLCFTVPISVVASFRKIREIVYDRSLLVAALRTSSELVNILI